MFDPELSYLIKFTGLRKGRAGLDIWGSSGPVGTDNLKGEQCLGKGGAGLDIWGSSDPVGTDNLKWEQCLGCRGCTAGLEAFSHRIFFYV